ncbi:tRNA pseudouridine(55) synthase TruB [Rhodobaculum claviforme]|uniref:tRNA pseudouridine synthase B n=1 Tax=Rhodobaculum claviforme TaxID=1549854 RepID=A0A934WI83_9RHOB|nr:tRNA pseudouridine(55) synthase TruB [Rhodobaculum claviforme]MBK5927945.1 tRNA pseudouridine(55) synthase TruB [Rhodobaculum claviforme]
MARRRRGKAINGWLVVDKPAGMTSTAVVNAVRRALDAQKAGHAGTLDPMATGVLAIALGEATKTVPYITDALKCYRFTVRLGIATDTDDAEGTATAHSDLRPSDADIEAGLAPFRGDILQVPPAYSAVKVAGQRAYDLAREGAAPELAARPLWVESLEMIARPDPDHVELEMVCGKGGYVRAIARDLGQALGCLGHVVALRRVWSGPFDADAGATIADIETGPEALTPRLLPLEAALADLPELPASPEGAARLRNGNPGLVLASEAEFGEEAWASYQGRALAVGIYKAGELHPTRVFGKD